MTNQEILTKAIQKAIDGGWLSAQKFKSFRRYEFDFDIYGEECSWCEIRQVYSMGVLYPHIDFKWYADEELIFNQDFAKALWGEEDLWYSEGRWSKAPKNARFQSTNPFVMEEWAYHLQQMVIADDPIKYLGDNI